MSIAHRPGAHLVSEARIPGEVPRYEIPGWREEYGVSAGITGRGEETGRGFDLGLWTPDSVEATMSRWRRFRGAEPGATLVVLANQVHGAELAVHQSAPARRVPGRAAPWLYLEGVDGHLTTQQGLVLTVTVADCVPVYLVAPGKAIGLLHAGWRGVAAGILERGISKLRELAGAGSADIVMHCGVAICGACYEVGSEVMEGCGLEHPGSGPWHLDLRELLVSRARALGLERVSRSTWCSAHHRSQFYSHRASGGADGRMVAYLSLIDSAPSSR